MFLLSSLAAQGIFGGQVANPSANAVKIFIGCACAFFGRCQAIALLQYIKERFTKSEHVNYTQSMHVCPDLNNFEFVTIALGIFSNVFFCFAKSSSSCEMTLGMGWFTGIISGSTSC